MAMIGDLFWFFFMISALQPVISQALAGIFPPAADIQDRA